MIIISHTESAIGHRPRASATLGVAVEDHLRDAIVTGTLEPGTPLKEMELSKSLEISSTPIRDALNRLAQTGLVDIFSNKAKRVSPLDKAVVVDLLEFRVIVANKAYAQAAERVDIAKLGQLRFQLDALKAALAISNHTEALKAVFQFDRLLITASGSKEANRITESRNSYLIRHILLQCPEWIADPLFAHHERQLAILEQREFSKQQKHIGTIWENLLNHCKTTSL